VNHWDLKLIAIFFFSVNASAKTICHPLPHFWQNQFIIGYGSLMDESSKKKTSSAASKNNPIFLKGFQRIWNVHYKNKTYLGIKAHPEHLLSAVFFKLPFYEIHSFDQREQSYCRISIPTKNILSIPSSKPLPNGQFWVYVPKKTYQSFNHPIPDYYVNLYLMACKKIANQHKLAKYYQSCLEDLPK